MNIIRIAFIVAAVLNIGGTVSAQATVCRTFVFPHQGFSSDGRNARNTSITIPAANEGGLDGIYPIVLSYPPGAVRVGLEFWNRTLYTDVPPFTLFIHGLIDRPDHRVVGGIPATDNAPYVHMTTNETRSESFALSTVLNPGEAYIVGMWNFNHVAVAVQFTIPVLVCFATQSEMDAYIRYVEP